MGGGGALQDGSIPPSSFAAWTAEAAGGARRPPQPPLSLARGCDGATPGISPLGRQESMARRGARLERGVGWSSGAAAQYFRALRRMVCVPLRDDHGFEERTL